LQVMSIKMIFVTNMFISQRSQNHKIVANCCKLANTQKVANLKHCYTSTPRSTLMHVRLVKYILFYLWWRKKFKKKSFRQRLSAEGRRRRARHLPCTALLSPPQSAWQRLYDSNEDSALIVLSMQCMICSNPFLMGPLVGQRKTLD
jgi:hypothetical protein